MKDFNYKISYFTSAVKNIEKILFFLNQEPIINLELIDCLELFKENPYKFGNLIECFVVYKNSDIKLVTFRAPSFNILISHTNDLGVISPLIKHMKSLNINIPGIYGPSKTVEEFTSQWANVYKENFQTSDESWLFLLEDLQIALKNIGSVKKATLEHEEILLKWSDAAVLELIPDSPDSFLESCRKNVSQRIRNKKVYILEINAELVSMGSIVSEANNMQIINNVYTPLNLRNKGYATELCTFLVRYIRFECKNYPVLSVFINNTPAIHLYQKIGFKKKGKVTLCLK
jgi:hypothetical protein